MQHTTPSFPLDDSGGITPSLFSCKKMVGRRKGSLFFMLLTGTSITLLAPAMADSVVIGKEARGGADKEIGALKLDVSPCIILLLLLFTYHTKNSNFTLTLLHSNLTRLILPARLQLQLVTKIPIFFVARSKSLQVQLMAGLFNPWNPTLYRKKRKSRRKSRR